MTTNTEINRSEKSGVTEDDAHQQESLCAAVQATVITENLATAEKSQHERLPESIMTTSHDSAFLAGSLSMHSDNDFVDYPGRTVPDTLIIDSDDDDDDDDEDYNDLEDDELEHTVSSAGSEAGNSEGLDGNDRRGRVVARLQRHQKNAGGEHEKRAGVDRKSSDLRGRLKGNRSKTFSTDSLLQGDDGRKLREERRKGSRRNVSNDNNEPKSPKKDEGSACRPKHRIVEVPKSDSVLKAVTDAKRTSELNDEMNDELDVRLHKGVEAELSPHPTSSRVLLDTNAPTDSCANLSSTEGDTTQNDNSRSAPGDDMGDDMSDEMDGDDMDGDNRRGRIVSRLQQQQQKTQGTADDSGSKEPPSRVGRLKANRGNNLSTDSLLEGDFGRKLREERRVNTRKKKSSNTSNDEESVPQPPEEDDEEEEDVPAIRRPSHRIVEVPKSSAVLQAVTAARQASSCDEDVFDELDIPLHKGETIIA